MAGIEPAKGEALTRLAAVCGVERKVWVDWRWWVFHLRVMETDKSLRKRASASLDFCLASNKREIGLQLLPPIREFTGEFNAWVKENEKELRDENLGA